jgi:hypothetical protein
MSALEQNGRTVRTRVVRAKPTLLVGLIVAAGALLFALANAHLVYVAVTSQPDCVAHVGPGESAAGMGSFSAAKPAC